jgi:heptosyltransferase III
MAPLMNRLFASGFATIFRVLARRSRSKESGPRILCLTRGGTGDMLDTLPLFHALRRHFPRGHLAVACDPRGSPIAQACEVVNDVIELNPNWNSWLAALKNAWRLQDYDWVIAAKSDIDLRMARLTRLTNATIRIGFERPTQRRSTYYTDPVALPAEPNEEHRIDTLLRLLKPLGLVKQTGLTVDLSLCVPNAARALAAEIMAQPPFDPSRRLVMINLSSTVKVKFHEEDFIALAGRLLSSTDFTVALVAAPADQPKAFEIAACMGSKRITSVETSEPLDLAALLANAAVLITPESEAAHLAAAVGTPAVILWSEGNFKKKHSRGRRHVFVHAESGEKTIPVERVWQTLQPFLRSKQDSVEKEWANLLELPPSPDFMS